MSSSVWAQTISEDAKRYFARGMAAVEMAKSPEGYESAIQEFEKAARLAPDWPDVYFNLGIAQEKAEKYRDAVGSLRQYLRLAPNAGDAEKVKSLVNKLEYKAEQYEMISDDEALDIFASLSDDTNWKITGTRSHLVGSAIIVRRVRDGVEVKYYSGSSDLGWIEQQFFPNKLTLSYALHPCKWYGTPVECHYWFLFTDVTIISRNLVRVQEEERDEKGTPGKRFTYEYIRKNES